MKGQDGIMRVVLAQPRGFCAGVNMAIECLDQALKICGSKIFVYHEIVHNKYVVERFTRQGVTFVNTIDEVPEGSILLYSAHGVSPQVRELASARRLKTIDATCPLVSKVHIEGQRYANQGREIILIGHAGHPEIVGDLFHLQLVGKGRNLKPTDLVFLAELRHRGPVLADRQVVTKKLGEVLAGRLFVP